METTNHPPDPSFLDMFGRMVVTPVLFYVALGILAITSVGLLAYVSKQIARPRYSDKELLDRFDFLTYLLALVCFVFYPVWKIMEWLRERWQGLFSEPD